MDIFHMKPSKLCDIGMATPHQLVFLILSLFLLACNFVLHMLSEYVFLYRKIICFILDIYALMSEMLQLHWGLQQNFSKEINPRVSPFSQVKEFWVKTRD